MRSIFNDKTKDFFEILSYPKEDWKKWFDDFDKKTNGIFKIGIEKNGYNKESYINYLKENIGRKKLDIVNWVREENIAKEKSKIINLITKKSDNYNLKRADFSVLIINIDGEKPYTVVETYKTNVILLDYIWYFDNKDKITFEELFEKAVSEYNNNYQPDDKKALFWVVYDEAKKIINGKKLDFIDALANICELLDKKIDYYNWTGFYLVDGNNKLKVGPYIGEETEHIEIEFGQGICGQAASTEKTFLIGDVSKEDNYLSCSPKTKSEIVVPLFDKKGEIAGEIDIDSHLVNPFDEKDSRLLEDICSLITERYL
ncbi:MAG: GAF domain-containing protein [Thermotogota bacterium]